MLKFITQLSILLVLWLILDITGLIPEPLRTYAVQAVKMVGILIIFIAVLALLLFQLPLWLNLLALLALVLAFTYFVRNFQVDVGIIPRTETQVGYESEPGSLSEKIPFLQSEEKPQ